MVYPYTIHVLITENRGQRYIFRVSPCVVLKSAGNCIINT